MPRSIQCPRCFHQVRVPRDVGPILVCKECTFAIPLAYIRDSQQMPPVFVQLFGLPNAGKTVFLDMLRLYLYSMDRAWGDTGFFAQPITQLDVDHKVQLLTERDRGIMPGSTPKRERNQNEVYIMLLKHMQRWGSRFLVLMDHSGESFGPLVIDMHDIPFLQHTPVTILLLSLPDLHQEGKRVGDLVNNYITSLEAYKVNFARERRRLVVVFSKADRLHDLPSEIEKYLSNDTIYPALRNFQQSFRMNERYLEVYIQWMDYINREMREWVGVRVPGGRAMLNMLNDKGIDARFTIMSSLGHSISSYGGNTLEPSPRRVLDPFFWVLEFYRQYPL